jgi:hypothetical protein
MLASTGLGTKEDLRAVLDANRNEVTTYNRAEEQEDITVLVRDPKCRQV